MDNTERTWRLIHLVAQGIDLRPHYGSTEFASGIDPGLLLAAAAHHKLLPALAGALQRSGYDAALSPRIASVLRQLRRATHYRTTLLTAEALRIDQALRAHDIPHVWTKGVVLQTALHQPGTRVLNDIDVMVPHSLQERVHSAVATLGFVANHQYNLDTQRLDPIERRQEILYKLSPDHMPHYHRLSGDLMVPVLTLDVAHSITWHDAPWQVPLEYLLSHSAGSKQVDDGLALPRLRVAHSFLFVCLHLFREAWFERNAQQQDVTLSQFGEVIRFWRHLDEEQRSEVGHEIDAYALEEPIAWVLGNTDLLFGSTLAADLSLQSFATDDWLHSIRGIDGRIGQWSGSMVDRMHQLEKPRLKG